MQRGQRFRERPGTERFLQQGMVRKKLKLEAEESMARDPVCGMSVEEVSGTAHTQFEGKKYYFCSDECQREFEAEPEGYVESAAA